MSGKRESRNWRLIAAVLIMLFAGVGCTASRGIERGVSWVDPGEQRIVFKAAGFKSSRPIRVKYTDVWQTEEYALFAAEGRQCEIIYAEANRTFTVALDYQMPIEQMVPTWNLNSGQNIIWGPLGRIDTRFETWFYRTYELSDIHRSCVGFMVEWDEIYEDPQDRPGKVLFGYLCAAEGMALENQQIHTLISGIGIRLQGERSDIQKAIYDIGADSHRSAPIETARGKNRSTDTGNPRFPFKFARYYSEGRGHEFN